MSTVVKIFLFGVALSVGGTLLWSRLRDRLRQATPNPIQPV